MEHIWIQEIVAGGWSNKEIDRYKAPQYGIDEKRPFKIAYSLSWDTIGVERSYSF